MRQLTMQDLIVTAVALGIIDLALFLAWMNKEHDNLAGGIVGAAGTILAGYAAWRGIQRQLAEQREATEEQRRANQHAIHAFWREEARRAEAEAAGVNIAWDLVALLAIALRSVRETEGPWPNLRAIKRADEYGYVIAASDPEVQRARDLAPAQFGAELSICLRSVSNRLANAESALGVAGYPANVADQWEVVAAREVDRLLQLDDDLKAAKLELYRRLLEAQAAMRASTDQREAGTVGHAASSGTRRG